MSEWVASQLPIPAMSFEGALRRRAMATPKTLALMEGCSRELWDGTKSQKMSFEQLNNAVDRHALAFSALQLAKGSVVALQMGNTIEHVIALLALMRAQLVPLELPLNWRSQELLAVCEMASAKAFVTHSRFGTFTPADEARKVAAQLFSLRFIMAYGDNPPDGVLPLSDQQLLGDLASAGTLPSSDIDCDELALIAPEMTSNGFSLSGWTHTSLSAASLLAILTMQLQAGQKLGSTLQLNAIPHMTSALGPMAYGGHALHLWQPQDPLACAKEASELNLSRLIVPATQMHDWSICTKVPLLGFAKPGQTIDMPTVRKDQNQLWMIALGNRAMLPASLSGEYLSVRAGSLGPFPDLLSAEREDESLRLTGAAMGRPLVRMQGKLSLLGEPTLKYRPLKTNVNQDLLCPDQEPCTITIGGQTWPLLWLEKKLRSVLPELVCIEPVDDALLGQRLTMTFESKAETPKLTRADIVEKLRDIGFSQVLKPHSILYLQRDASEGPTPDNNTKIVAA